ncbi:ascorbate-specific PTS system enzyme II Ccomponent [Mycoplasmopsis caviae]|uniref:Ascorbate-specific PTS system enzyme II Ccomponent n=1 Tax=Mycoplasmopsis caviae TaxID=55603 RepID=A0A3P8KD97_9BACT|nr:ascorbate-specific PTS system enzyme II Ccomponent [Mycoplasmopsis caviae]
MADKLNLLDNLIVNNSIVTQVEVKDWKDAIKQAAYH